MLKLFAKLKWWQYFFIVAIIIIVFIQVYYFDLVLPDKMGEILDLLDPKYQEKIGVKTTNSDIINVGLEMLLIVVGSLTCTIIGCGLAAYIAADLAKKTRHDIFDKVNQFSMEEISNFSTSSLITRTTNDVSQVQMVTVMLLRFAVMSPIMATLAIIKVYNKSYDLSAVTGVAVISMLALMTFLVITVLPKFSKMQKLTDRLNAVSRENLTGLRVIRAYNAQELELKKFDEANEDITKTNLFVNRTFSIMTPGMNIIFSGMALALTWFGAYLIPKGLAFSDLAVFMQYSAQILMSFMFFVMILIMLPRAIVSAKRINMVLDTKVKIINGNLVKGTIDGEIEFKDVSFRYPDAEGYILKNINLQITKGQTVAFIGSTGSGKSTLVNLVARLYDVSSGELIIDGINVKSYDLKALYNKIGYIPQQGILFNGTIRENINYGDLKVSDEEIKEALKIAQADFVETLEGGLDYHIAQGGKNVSGGQRQRLAIARAILKKPSIYIFDDSFSALDYKTDRALRAALKQNVGNAINLIVAQRVGTIIEADKIVVLEHGEIVGVGTHLELLENCKVYQEIAYSQLSKEELI